MKQCPNPDCASSFLFGDSKTVCPFCHAPLVRTEGAAPARNLITPADIELDDRSEESAPAFITRTGGSVVCTGRILEIEHQALFYSTFHKLFNAVVRGEPFQLAHQSVEYTIRVEPITDGVPTEVTDFCLYGNFLGRIQVGDEVRIRAKDSGHRRVVRSIVNLTTGSAVKPGLQISAAIIRGVLLAAVLLFAAFACMVVQFVTSGEAAAFLIAIVMAFMPILISIAGLWLLIRSVFPKREGRR